MVFETSTIVMVLLLQILVAGPTPPEPAHIRHLISSSPHTIYGRDYSPWLVTKWKEDPSYHTWYWWLCRGLPRRAVLVISSTSIWLSSSQLRDMLKRTIYHDLIDPDTKEPPLQFFHVLWSWLWWTMVFHVDMSSLVLWWSMLHVDVAYLILYSCIQLSFMLVYLASSPYKPHNLRSFHQQTIKPSRALPMINVIA